MTNQSNGAGDSKKARQPRPPIKSEKGAKDRKPQPPVKSAQDKGNGQANNEPTGFKGWLLRKINKMLSRLSKFQ